jgi:hypothetical protein
VTWPFTLSVLAAAELLGHALAYRIAQPDAAERALLLQRAGHGYVAYLDAAAAACLAVAAWALCRRALASYRGSAASLQPGWRLALLAPAAFILQEHTERLVHSGTIEWATAAEPAVAIGVGVQVLLGVLAIYLVRGLLRLAHRAGRVFAAAAATRPRRRALPVRISVRAADPFRPVALAGCAAGRAPPHPA